MFSKEKLVRIVKDKIEDKIRKGEISADAYNCYYILLNGEIYQAGDYDEEVANGTRSPNDIYAYVYEWDHLDFDDFLFHTNYLSTASVIDFVFAYLRKMGFTIDYVGVYPPTPNLKYFIYVAVEYSSNTPDYLAVSVYDVDTLARALHIPQVVEQKLGSQPREITSREFFDINDAVAYDQPLLAGYAYDDAYRILDDYFVFHEEDYKDEAYKISLAYMNLFPEPYKVCYKWEARTFDKINCLKLELRRYRRRFNKT